MTNTAKMFMVVAAITSFCVLTIVAVHKIVTEMRKVEFVVVPVSMSLNRDKYVIMNEDTLTDEKWKTMCSGVMFKKVFYVKK